jgi:hypothetical protein
VKLVGADSSPAVKEERVDQEGSADKGDTSDRAEDFRASLIKILFHRFQIFVPVKYCSATTVQFETVSDYCESKKLVQRDDWCGRRIWVPTQLKWHYIELFVAIPTMDPEAVQSQVAIDAKYAARAQAIERQVSL